MCPSPCGPRRSPRRSRKSESEAKYAAVFTIGYLKTVAQSDTLTGLIDCLWCDLDLSCLSRQAQVMGDENDAKSAKMLDRFLEKYYEGSLKVKDIKDLHLEFSIGSLSCIDFASGEDEVLELMERHAPKPADPARKHCSSDKDALQNSKLDSVANDVLCFLEDEDADLKICPISAQTLIVDGGERRTLGSVFLQGKKFPISGGNGTSMEDAIVINSNRNDEAVSIEYAVLREYYAIKGQAYEVGIQFLLSDDQGRSFDQLDVTIFGSDNTETTESWYFDITQSFGNH